jgi:DNA-binding transcriptional ArsR family regulator
MGSPWKAVSDDSRRQILVMLKEKERTPTEIARHFDFTLPALSTHLRVLREADLVSERKEGQNKFYSVNREKMSEMTRFFDIFWDDKLASLKEYLEKKEMKKRH